MTPSRATAGMERRIFLIATEESGDRLGANLMKVLRQRLGDGVRFEGVGGRAMAREGLDSLFPIEELSIIGLADVVKELPKILGLIKETAIAVVEAAPDILVIIDSPDFTHRVAKRVRAKAPQLPIVNYVSPTVWAWRPGRARAMLKYVDHVLALLPFEPEAYRRLHGPPCSYVGHPLTEQLASLRPNAEEAARRAQSPPVLLVLPGSRRSEIRHHMAVFGQAVARLQEQGAAFELVLPTMPHLQEAVVEAVKTWPVQPQVVIGEQEKRRQFRIAHAALAKSGTVTLELALAGVPMVTAYRIGPVEAWILRRAIKVKFGDPGQSRDRRECHSRIPAGRLHAGKTRRRALREVLERQRCVGSSWRRSEDRRICRPATSRRAFVRPISCWRRCGRRGGDFVEGWNAASNPLTGRDGVRLAFDPSNEKPDAIASGFDRLRHALTCACPSARSRGGRRRCRAGADGRSSAAGPRSSRSTG